ncbi:MAG: hypothetical protein HRT61_02725 [Ekhidna sp.]|nr:hypothetical protein [Ekhidna sp.]
MKYLAILSFLVSTVLNAQTTFKSLQEYQPDGRQFNMTPFAKKQLKSLELNLPPETFSQVDPLSDPQMFTPNQYNVGYPFGDVTDMNDMLLGSSLTNTVQVGRKMLRGTYIFDVQGNMRSYEFTISKKKK